MFDVFWMLTSLAASLVFLLVFVLLSVDFLLDCFCSVARKKAHTRFTPQNTMEFIDFQGARLHRRRRQDKENMANTTNNKHPKMKDIAKYLKIDHRSTILVYKGNEEVSRTLGQLDSSVIYSNIEKGI